MSERAKSGGAVLPDDDLARVAVALGRAPSDAERALVAEVWSERCAARTAAWLLAPLHESAADCGAVPHGAGLAAPLADGVAAILCVAAAERIPEGADAAASAAVGEALLRVASSDAHPLAILDAIRLRGGDERPARSAVAALAHGVAEAAGTAGVAVLGGDLGLDSGCAAREALSVVAIGIGGSGHASPPVEEGAPVLLLSAGQEGASRRRALLAAIEELRGAGLLRGAEPVGRGGIARAAIRLGARVGAGIALTAEALRGAVADESPLSAALQETRDDRLLVIPTSGHGADLAAHCAAAALRVEPLGHATPAARLTLDDPSEAERIDLPIDLLAAPPAQPRRSVEPTLAPPTVELRLGELPEPRDYGAALYQIISAPNLASRRYLYEQMDSFCGGMTSLHPGADAAALRPVGTPLQVGMTVDGPARFAALDPYVGACIAVCESARNLVAIGAKPVAAAVRLDAGPAESPEVIWQLQQCVTGLRDASVSFGIPVLDCGLGFSSDERDALLPPGSTVAMVGMLQGPVALTPWFKAHGDLIFLVGRTRDELAGAEFAAVVHGATGGTPPWVDLEAEKRLQRVVLEAVERALLTSAHDVAAGGIALAVVEGCCASPDGVPARGARIRPDETMRPDAWLFGESQARMLVTARRENAAALREIAAEAGVAITLIGEVGGTMLDIEGLITVSVAELKASWGRALGRWLEEG